MLSMFTGMRMGEINALEVKDVNVKQRSIHVHQTITKDRYDNAVVGKTTKNYAGTRTLYVSKDIIDLLVKCIGDKKSGQIFLRKGELITTTKVNILPRIIQYGLFNRNSSSRRVDIYHAL